MAKAMEVTGKLLMPKATAVWLIENTALSFKQIADFTSLTEIEVEALANEDIGRGLVGRDPIENGELDAEDLERAQKDPAAKLKLISRDLPPVKIRAKGPRYTPVSKRSDKPDAIAFILKHNPEISDAQICRLVGTTKPTIKAVRERTHPNTPNLKPRHPAELGLCTYQEYEKASNKGLRAQGKDPEKVKAEKAAALAAQHQSKTEDEPSRKDVFGGFDFSNFISGTKSTENKDQ